MNKRLALVSITTRYAMQVVCCAACGVVLCRWQLAHLAYTCATELDPADAGIKVSGLHMPLAADLFSSDCYELNCQCWCTGVVQCHSQQHMSLSLTMHMALEGCRLQQAMITSSRATRAELVHACCSTPSFVHCLPCSPCWLPMSPWAWTPQWPSHGAGWVMHTETWAGAGQQLHTKDDK
jgi:hypothetical protein